MEDVQFSTSGGIKRRKRYLVFLLWEIARFMLVWSAAGRAFNIDQSISTALVLLWISAPVLALIAAFFLLWYHDGEEHPRLHAVTVMAKGFQVILGGASTLLLIRSFGVHPLFFRGEFLTTGVTTVVDFMICLVLLRSARQR